MLVHQAFYGESKGTHTLLAASIADEVSDTPEAVPPSVVTGALFTRLVAHTDLPFRAPSNASWAPYLSGFAFENCYILSKTFPDPDATRSGMVFTHLLAAPLSEVGCLTDIRLLLNQLLPSPDKNRRTLVPFEVALSAKSGTSPSQWPQGFPSLVKALLSASDTQNNRPVVWVGQHGFAEAVAALWINLWPQIRENLRFRLCFEPQDIEDGVWTMVAIPQGCEARWRAFAIVRGDDASTDTKVAVTKSEAFLLGLAEADPMRDLLRDLEVWPSRLADLSKVEKCCEFLSLQYPATDEVRALVRFLGLLSPDEAKGVAIKQRALNSLIERSLKGNAEEITALKNIDLAPFAQGETLLSQAVQQWSLQNILAGKRKADEENAFVLVKALQAPGRWWSDAIQDALNAVLPLPSSWKQELTSSVWVWWQAQPVLVDLLSPFIPKQNEVERELTNRCPTRLSLPVGDAIKAWARSRYWPVLHAATLASTVLTTSAVPKDALVQSAFREQLSFDRAPEFLEGLRILAQRFGDQASLQAALQIGENRLLQIAGEACAAQPELMVDLDVRNASWRQVWAWSIRKHRRLWSGMPDPDQVAQDLLTVFAEGEPVDEEVLQLLAQEPQSDLTLHPARCRLWSRFESVDAMVARSFLESTAEGWLSRFRNKVSGKTVEPNYNTSSRNLEAPLTKVVTEENRLKRHLLRRDADLGAFGVELMGAFASISQALAISWLDDLMANGSRIDSAYSKQFGVLVARKGWSDVANHMANSLWRYSGEAWLPALRECQSLLSAINKLKVKAGFFVPNGFGSGSFYPGSVSSKSTNTTEISANENEWWEALQTLCVELYPVGPQDRMLWSRAEGDTSKLEFRGSGNQQWQSALLMLKRGGGGKNIRVPKLLERMREDFTNNHELNFLTQTLPSAHKR